MSRANHRRISRAILVFSALVLVWIILPILPARPAREVASFYVSNGVMASLSPPRLLTKNAHVTQSLCSPNGIEVAYTTAEEIDGITYTTLAVQNLSGGEPHIYRELEEPDIGKSVPPGGFQRGSIDGLASWSPNGQFLIFMMRQSDTGLKNGTVYWSLNTRNSKVSPLTGQYGGLMNIAWSPDSARFAYTTFKDVPTGPDANGVLSYTKVTEAWYHEMLTGREHDMVDAKWTEAHQDSPILPTIEPTGFRVDAVGWIDSQTCAFNEQVAGARPFWNAYDVIADKAGGPIKSTTKLVSTSGWDNASQATMTLPGGQVLALYCKPVDPKANANHASEFTDVYIQSLKSADDYDRYIDTTTWTYKPDKRSTLVDVITDTRGAAFVPTGGFSGGIYHVIYNSWGDLRVVDITLRQASTRERLAGGDSLSCDEEQEIARSDGKEIALGIIQYVQDYDERMPLPESFKDEVYPYEQNDEPFAPIGGKYKFVYTPPDDLFLEHMANPAQVVIGYIDLPCAHIKVFADGHVK